MNNEKNSLGVNNGMPQMGTTTSNIYNNNPQSNTKDNSNVSVFDLMDQFAKNNPMNNAVPYNGQTNEQSIPVPSTPVEPPLQNIPVRPAPVEPPLQNIPVTQAPVEPPIQNMGQPIINNEHSIEALENQQVNSSAQNIINNSNSIDRLNQDNNLNNQEDIISKNNSELNNSLENEKQEIKTEVKTKGKKTKKKSKLVVIIILVVLLVIALVVTALLFYFKSMKKTETTCVKQDIKNEFILYETATLSFKGDKFTGAEYQEDVEFYSDYLDMRSSVLEDSKNQFTGTGITVESVETENGFVIITSLDTEQFASIQGLDKTNSKSTIKKMLTDKGYTCN